MRAEMRERIQRRVPGAEEAGDQRHRDRHRQEERERDDEGATGSVHGAHLGKECGLLKEPDLRRIAYWNAVSEKERNLREWSRSGGISASFSTARMPIVRC